MNDEAFGDNTAARYDRWYETRWGRYADERQRQLLVHMCEPQPGEKVLDVGCGTGRYLQWFAEMGLEATGVDNSAEMVQVARQRLAGSGEEAVLLADGTDLPFADDSFDLVTAITVLEFVEHPDKLIAEMLRVSHDRIFLGVLNRYSPYYVQQRLRRGRILSQAHFYSVGEVLGLVREAGGQDIMWHTTLQGPAIGPPVLHHISRLRDCLPGLSRLPGGAYIGVCAHCEALNERAVEYGVVMPIVKALGWDPENMDEMRPEYAVESRRVDWAFLKDGRPCLFLEEKAPDQNLSAHEEQLLDYAFKQGIRLAVLTNGRDWWFYLPLEEGPWAERRFLTVDLVNQKTDEVSLYLTQFLQKDFVFGGFAYKDAKERYDESREQQRIERELPGAIQGLFSDPSERVIEFLQNQTQGAIGALPPAELVNDALATVFGDRGRIIEAQGSSAPPRGEAQGKRGAGLPRLYAKLVRVAIKGEPLDGRTWTGVLVQTANWLIAKGYGDKLPYEVLIGTKRILVSKSQSGIITPKRLTNGTYIDSYCDCTHCVKNARWLLRQVGLAEDILQVEWEERTE
jgi:ubiquinone/menaquinone biosynthesis C-methylase UbiE